MRALLMLVVALQTLTLAVTAARWDGEARARADAWEYAAQVQQGLLDRCMAPPANGATTIRPQASGDFNRG